MNSKWFVGILAALIIAVGVIVATRPSTPPEEKKGSLSSLRTTPAPWPAENEHLRERLLASNLPLLNVEGTALHIHQHLDIYIHGQPVTIPADTGYSNTISPIHTHDASGVIHVESPDPNAQYSLQQCFNVWGVKFTNSQIGSYTNDSINELSVYSNGQLVKDPINLKLVNHQEIAVIYGSEQEKPTAIPKTYDFPKDL